MYTINKQTGHTISELMVAIALALALSTAALTIYMGQTRLISSETQRNQAASEAHVAFATLSRILRQAEADSINIVYKNNTKPNSDNQAEIANDAIQIDFMLPRDYPIWPNDIPPYQNNAVRITWSNDPNDAAPYSIQIASATTLAALSSASFRAIAGANTADNARIINLDLWSLSDVNTLQASPNAETEIGYLFRITSRTGKKDLSFTNKLDPDGNLKHFRTSSASGTISPRN